MDSIIPADKAVAPKDTKPADKGTSAPKAASATPAAAPKEEAKPAESKATSRRRSAAASNEGGAAEPAAASAPAAATAESTSTASSSSKKSSRRGGSSSSSSETAAPAEAAPAEAAAAPKDDKKPAAAKKTDKDQKPVDPRDISFMTTEGGSGLWEVPTARIIKKGRAGISYYWGKYSASASESETGQYGYDYSVSTSENLKSYSIAYGVDDNLEVYIGQQKAEATANLSVNGISASGDASAKNNDIGFKYKPGRRVLLKKDTKKKWDYAIGAERTKTSDIKGSKFYAVADFPFPKFNVHGGVFQINRRGIKGKRLGTEAAVEFVVTPRVLIFGEGILYQSTYTYNLAMRYIYKNTGALMLGVNDVTEMQIKSVGFSYLY